VLDSSGALYGVTEMGGTVGAGTVFQLVPPSGSSGQWTENVLYNFTSSDVYYPSTGLVFDPARGAFMAEPRIAARTALQEGYSAYRRPTARVTRGRRPRFTIFPVPRTANDR
jgi:uncharacterized repeat protein (TIGR03803 family)